MKIMEEYGELSRKERESLKKPLNDSTLLLRIIKILGDTDGYNDKTKKGVNFNLSVVPNLLDYHIKILKDPKKLKEELENSDKEHIGEYMLGLLDDLELFASEYLGAYLSISEELRELKMISE